MERAYPIILLKSSWVCFLNSNQKFTCVWNNVFSKNSFPIRIQTAETGEEKFILRLGSPLSAPPDKVPAFGIDGAAFLPGEPTVYILFKTCDFIYIKPGILQPSLRWICRSFVQKFA